MIETAEREPARHADGIVALTGGADRVSDAVELLAQGHADRLLITGVNPIDHRPKSWPDACRMRASWSIAASTSATSAVNTVGNARETARLGAQPTASAP